MRGAGAAVLALLLSHFQASAAGLRVAAVQFAVSERVYRCVEDFRAAVHDSLEAAFASFRPDLVVFPEYTAAFLAVMPYAGALQGADDLPEALDRVGRVDASLSSPRDVLLRQSAFVERTVREVFGGEARSRKVWVISGSHFARVRGPAGGDELRNRACLFSPGGDLAYFQDKVYLTEIERDVLGVSPGRMVDARPFDVKGRRVALTICRDSYKEGWEETLRGAYLWIDIKANGVSFTQQERKGFLEGMPSRLGRARVSYGLTVCLVGGILGQVWEGETGLWTTGSAGARQLACCLEHAEWDVLRVELDGDPAGSPR